LPERTALGTKEPHFANQARHDGSFLEEDAQGIVPAKEGTYICVANGD
jgi:hypothetical protein